MKTLFEIKASSPLAEKMRPNTLDEFIGQEHILGEGKILRRIIEADRLIPMIFWGPPGCGKTSIARIIADNSHSKFIALSAVTSGVAELRKTISAARDDLQFQQIRTILFVDEIHRFNKSQQDYLLPHVEDGTVILIGATTENPSFQVNAPLLSRCRVFHFRELSIENLYFVIDRCIEKINQSPESFFAFLKGCKVRISIKRNAKEKLAELCEGDARDLYNAIELSILSATKTKNQIMIDEKLAEEAIQQKFIRYDKGADGHFDAISALHKSIRASQPDASLHYLARMLEAGEEPLYIIRRLIRCAAEDIGLADPFAMVLATSTLEAVRHLGMPESNDVIAELVIYLSLAPKSRAVDEAYAAAKSDVLNKRLEPIPLKIRNAPTKMMREFGFGQGYKMYDNNSNLPSNLQTKKYWKQEDINQE